MIKVPLTRGRVALIDNLDHELVSKYNWVFDDSVNGGPYARATIRKNGRATSLRMHRLIKQARKGYVVDHINQDGLDNRRSNLRMTINRNNAKNKRPKKRFKGIMQTKSGKWSAQIGFNGNHKYLGTFLTAQEAAKIYNRAALKYHGKFACLNVL